MRDGRLRSAKIFWLLLLLVAGSFLGGTVAAAETGVDQPQPLVTATFFETDLREALHEIAIQTGINMTIDENVRGLVTLELKEVPLEKALKMILISGGFSFRKVDDFYVIGWADPRNPGFAGLAESRVYYFKNISVDSAKALLPEFYKPYVKFGIGDKERQDVAMVSAPPDLLQSIMADLEKMDGHREQIKIRALVTEVSNEVLKEWGMDLLNIDFNVAKGSGLEILKLNIPEGTISGTGLADFGKFETAIKALANEKKAVIHADPVLLVTEGESGELFIGEKKTLILHSQGTSSTSSSTENVEAGTALKVAPRLLNGQIELAVSERISGFDNSSTEEITIKTREYNSVVRFMPGQTIMVAGLTEKKEQDNTLKTPILGDIPIIGWLFKQKSKFRGDMELLLFLTGEVVKE